MPASSKTISSGETPIQYISQLATKGGMIINIASPEDIPVEQVRRGRCIVETPALFYEGYPQGRFFPNINPFFAGRQKELEALKKAFVDLPGGDDIEKSLSYRESKVAPDSPIIFAQGIGGWGGVGKTQLAVEYLYELMNEEVEANKVDPLERRYALKVWLRGERKLLEEDLRNLAAYLGFGFDYKTPIEGITPCVYDRLAILSSALNCSHPRVLFVLDDGYWSKDLEPLLPSPKHSKHFHWLITSREAAGWANYFGKHYFKLHSLSVFSKPEALDYFSRSFDESVKSNNADFTEEHQENLARHLEYLPLALAQAVAYINRQIKIDATTSINSYLQLIEVRGLGLDPNESVKDYNRPVITTWLIGLPILLNVNPFAVELLLACAYLSGEAISLGLLRAYAGDVLNQDIEMDANVKRAVLVLEDYSFVENLPVISPGIRQHQLLQEVLRSWMSGMLLKKIDRESIKNEIIRIDVQIEQRNIFKSDIFSKLSNQLLKYSQEQALSVKDLERQAALIPHLEAVANSFKSALSIENPNLVFASILHRLGAIYLEKGDAERAKNVLERASVILNPNNDSEHLKVAKILIDLGNAYGAIGNATKKKKLLEKALKIQRHHFATSQEVAKTLRSLGNAYGALGNAQKRKELLKKALAIFQDPKNLDKLEEARTLGHLGCAYGDLGNAAKKKKLLKQALKIQKHNYDPNRPEIATTLGNLGHAYGALNNPAKEKDLLEQALSILEKFYGLEHPEVAKALYNLAHAELALGQIDLALEHARRCLEILERAFGKSHPYISSAHDLVIRCEHQYDNQLSNKVIKIR